MPSPADLSPAELAARGREITGRDIFQDPPDDNITGPRVEELMAAMRAAAPEGGIDLAYGTSEAQRLRLWTPAPRSPPGREGGEGHKAPIIIFIHGGSWKSGTYLDSLGSLKVSHLVRRGYAFASVNYTLIPSVTVEEQVQEVARAVAFLSSNNTSETHGLDGERIVLMGHSSGAHVAALLGTDTRYLSAAGISDMTHIRGVVALDGSNFNAAAEVVDSPGPVASSTAFGLGTGEDDDKMARLWDMSPTYHARAPNAGAFLLLQAQRRGDIRQAVELKLALRAAGTECEVHVFEGPGFEGHVAMLLRLGDTAYPATGVLDRWLERHVPVS